MAIANYTTKIAVSKTVAEVSQMLAEAGAESININYADKKPVSIFFVIDVGGQPTPFKLPVNWLGALNAMRQDSDVPGRFETEDHARRVSWRLVRDWVRVQLAFVEAQQATIAQLFLPHMVREDGQTLYEVIEQNGLKAITASAKGNAAGKS